MAKLQLNRVDGKKGSKKVIDLSGEGMEAFHKLKEALAPKIRAFQVDPRSTFCFENRCEWEGSGCRFGARKEIFSRGKWVGASRFP